MYNIPNFNGYPLQVLKLIKSLAKKYKLTNNELQEILSIVGKIFQTNMYDDKTSIPHHGTVSIAEHMISDVIGCYKLLKYFNKLLPHQKLDIQTLLIAASIHDNYNLLWQTTPEQIRFFEELKMRAIKAKNNTRELAKIKEEFHKAQTIANLQAVHPSMHPLVAVGELFNDTELRNIILNDGKINIYKIIELMLRHMTPIPRQVLHLTENENIKPELLARFSNASSMEKIPSNIKKFMSIETSKGIKLGLDLTIPSINSIELLVFRINDILEMFRTTSILTEKDFRKSVISLLNFAKGLLGGATNSVTLSSISQLHNQGLDEGLVTSLYNTYLGPYETDTTLLLRQESSNRAFTKLLNDNGPQSIEKRK